MDAALEPATPAHAAALALLHASAFPERERWGADAMALQLGLPGAFGWIAPEGGLVLARAAADEAEILTLAVHPDGRRRGLARRLLNRAMEEAAERGAVAIFLEVAEANLAAQALYAGAGFAVVGQRPAYYPGGAAALVLRAAIPYGSAAG
ncbi:MAG: hypothetical protein NVSMB18_34940 [Acetobacteraceae bacterium]